MRLCLVVCSLLRLWNSLMLVDESGSKSKTQSIIKTSTELQNRYSFMETQAFPFQPLLLKMLWITSCHFLVLENWVSEWVKAAQLCLTLCEHMDCSLPNSSIHGDSPGKNTLEWVAMPSSRGSSQPRDWTQVSCIAGGCSTIWATREDCYKITFWLKFFLHSPVHHWQFKDWYMVGLD